MNLKFLFVFDDSLDLKRISDLGFPREGEVVLFPLSSDWRLIHQVESFLCGKKELRVHLLNSAKLVDSKVDALCREIPEWSAQCGAQNVDGKTVREHFLLPGKGPSAFWFGPISEKNPLKTDSFLLLAQADAVSDEVKRGEYGGLAVAVGSFLLEQSLEMMAEQRNLRSVKAIGQTTVRRGLDQLGLVGTIILAVTGWVQGVARAIEARLVMGLPSFESEVSKEKGILAISYFPYLDDKAAEQGRFENKYFAPLQHAMREEGRNILWLLVFVYINGGSFREALRTAKRLANHGERLAFPEQFFGFKESILALIGMLMNIFRYVRLERKIHSDAMCGGLVSNSCIPIIRDLWRRSFCGLEAMRGLMFYLAWKRALRLLPSFDQSVYLCEMQIWEKALIAAARRVQPKMKLIGFEHTSVSKNYTFFRHAKSDFESVDKPAGVPLPDVLACNGRLAKEQLAASGYRNLTEVEAIRHLYLADIFSDTDIRRSDRPILLVAGSIIREETKALLSLIHEASLEKEEWEVWLKGHPSMPIEDILNDMNVDATSSGWMIKAGDIRTYLEKAAVAIVPTSSVSIDALALGCDVVVPVFSNFFLMSPLAGFEAFYQKVHDPNELKTFLRNYSINGKSVCVRDKRDFVRDYWHLETGLPRWRGLLKLEDPKEVSL